MSYAGEQVDPFDHCHCHEICFVIIDIVMITSSNNLFVQRSIEENKIGNNQLHTFNKPYRLMKQEELLTVDEYPPLENNGRMSVEASLGKLYWGDEGTYDMGNRSVAAECLMNPFAVKRIIDP